MIAKIEGYLEAVSGGTALVRMPLIGADPTRTALPSASAHPGPALTYELLLSAYAAARLVRSIGTTVTIHTLHYLEGQNQGAMFLPRLVGFLTVEDRQFYELFTTCKGIGHRRALRAMTLSTDVIAAAIADRDLDLLQSLPEIGRRTAETIVATLRGKVDRFVAAATYPTGKRSGHDDRRDDTTGGEESSAMSNSSVAREALKVLLQLGETRIDSVRWIDQALVAGETDGDERPKSPEDLIARVYRIKASS